MKQHSEALGSWHHWNQQGNIFTHKKKKTKKHTDTHRRIEWIIYSKKKKNKINFRSLLFDCGLCENFPNTDAAAAADSSFSFDCCPSATNTSVRAHSTPIQWARLPNTHVQGTFGWPMFVCVRLRIRYGLNGNTSVGFSIKRKHGDSMYVCMQFGVCAFSSSKTHSPSHPFRFECMACCDA